MSPAVGRARPASMRSKVVFPDPDGPTMQTNSPARTSRSMLARICRDLAEPAANVKPTPRIDTANSAPAAGARATARMVVGRTRVLQTLFVPRFRHKEGVFLFCLNEFIIEHVQNPVKHLA